MRRADLRDPHLSRLNVELSVVLNCRNIEALGLAHETLLDDMDYTAGQELAAAAIRRGCEGLVVPSATGFKDPKRVVFPQSMRGMSHITFVGAEDLRLYVPEMTS